jgi:hypothetical protein
MAAHTTLARLAQARRLKSVADGQRAQGDEASAREAEAEAAVALVDAILAQHPHHRTGTADESS